MPTVLIHGQESTAGCNIMNHHKAGALVKENSKTTKFSNCQSCITESRKLSTDIPRRELLLIWIIHASQGFQTTMLFPMLVFMVERFGLGGGNQQLVGQYAGILASLFPLAQFCTSWMWGAISDRTGRKPWVAFGNIVSAVCALLLGLCKSYSAACAVRFMGGLLNGTVTITKSMLGELCDESSQAKGFSILNLAWGIGSITGPVISGLLAEPCLQYSISSCPHFLSEYPFFLPCLVAIAFSIVAVFASWSLKETNAQKLKYERLFSQNMELDEVVSFQLQPLEHSRGHDLKLKNYFQKEKKSEGDELKTTEVNKRFVSLALEDVKGEKAGSTVTGDQFVLLDRSVLLATICYSMTGLIFIITDELFPMFGAASTTVGGLGFSSSVLGLILGEGGIVLFLYTLFLYPIVAQNVTPLNSFRYGIVLSVPLLILFPMGSVLSGIPPLQWAIILTVMGAKAVTSSTAFTGILILISNSASPQNMGAVTGLSNSFCSFFRAVGPAMGGMIWSSTSKSMFPFHQFLAWLFVAGLSCCTFGLSFLLPPSLNKPKNSNLDNL